MSARMTMHPAGNPMRKRIAIARQIAAVLGRRPEVRAVCVGGSTALGLADDDSDIEIQALCSPSKVPATERRRIYARLSGSKEDSFIYSWGKRVLDFFWKDGIWVEVEFRRIGQLKAMIAEARSGRACHRQAPFGHYGYAILGDVHHWRVLLDKDGVATGLKKKAVIGESLRRTILKQGGFLSDPQVIREYGKACKRADIPDAMGCLNSITDHFIQVAFALNRQYYTGNKWSSQLMRHFRRPSPGFYRRLGKLLVLGNDRKALRRKSKLVYGMFDELKEAVNSELGIPKGAGR